MKIYDPDHSNHFKPTNLKMEVPLYRQKLSLDVI